MEQREDNPKDRIGGEDQLSEEEFARETGEPLPDRAVPHADVAIPVNPALAADILAGPDEDFGEPVESDETASEKGRVLGAGGLLDRALQPPGRHPQASQHL